jgi:hypothetical protein
VCIDVLYGDVLSRRRFVCAPTIDMYYCTYTRNAADF